MKSKKEQIEILSSKISPARYAKMLRALEWRTRKICVAMEDVFQSHNAAAILRSCDAFGLQSVHFIENKYLLKISDNVDMGVSKWMDVIRYRSGFASYQRSGMPKPKTQTQVEADNTREALLQIKGRGYALAASVLDDSAMALSDIPVDKPLCLMIGTELSGLSEAACDLADYRFSLPMLGFAQSFNLSVFTALCLSNLCGRMRKKNDDWKMSDDEKEELLLHWLKVSVNNADSLLL